MSNLTGMANTLTIKSVGVGRFELSQATQAHLGYLATLELEGLKVSAQFYEQSIEGLVRYFDLLAINRKGWIGEKVWSSMNNDCIIACVHDRYDRVQMAVQLSCNKGKANGWIARGDLLLDTSSLEEIARAARRLLLS